MAREERSFTLTEPAGLRRTYVLLDYMTIDDVMEVAQQAVAARIKGNIAYEEDMFPRALKDDLVRVRIDSGV